MKKKILLGLGTTFLFINLVINSVLAMSGGKYFGAMFEINGERKNLNVYDDYGSIFSDQVSGSGENLTINNINTNIMVIENYELGTFNVNINLVGNNYANSLDLYGYSGSITISGEGSFRFMPSKVVSESEADYTINEMPLMYIRDVSEQQNWMNNKISTNLPVTYTDGYICINCYIEPAVEPTIEQTQDNTNQNVSDIKDSSNDVVDNTNEKEPIISNDNLDEEDLLTFDNNQDDDENIIKDNTDDKVDKTIVDDIKNEKESNKILIYGIISSITVAVAGTTGFIIKNKKKKL